MKSFKKLYTDFSVKEKRKLTIIKTRRNSQVCQR